MPSIVHAASPSSEEHDCLAPLLDVLWADRRMSFAQVRAVDQVAQWLGIDGVATRITRFPSSRLERMPPVELRADLYALGVWVAAMDGRVHESERRVLARMADAWQLSLELQRKLRRSALSMARVAQGRPTQAQLGALLRAVRHLSSEADVSLAEARTCAA